jgi:hypothetical protein
MANTQLKAQKRKKKLAKKAKKQNDFMAMFFDGDKYLNLKYVPLMYSLEAWLCQADKELTEAGHQGISDVTIGKAYKKLIQGLMQGTLKDLAKEAAPVNGSDDDDKLTENVFNNLSSKAFNVVSSQGYVHKDVLGILRTMNTSLHLINNNIGHERGYIEFLKDHLGGNDESYYGLHMHAHDHDHSHCDHDHHHHHAGCNHDH